MLSITTDFVQGTGCPEPYLRRIADAGFSHIHWCHHWNTDFIYSEHEIDQIAEWLEEYGLQLNDLHASDGIEKSWISALEYERLAGVELIKNRIRMAARLASDVIILHLQPEPEEARDRAVFWSQALKSLDALEPYAGYHGVRIALENLPTDNYLSIEKVLTKYSRDYIGICYDSGHGNCCGDGLQFLERFKERLIALHLHDNDGDSDQHNLPFSGTVNWPRLAHLIAASAYTRCMTLEVSIHPTGIQDEYVFLAQAFATGASLAEMVDAIRRQAG